jgi:endonuclease YncB( thermonuclease family)
MKSIIAFWKRDIINKLIVIVLLALVGGGFAFGWLIFNMPQGKSLTDAFADLLPEQATPTFDLNTYLTPGGNVPAAPTATKAPVLPLTFALPPPTPIVELPTPTLELLPTLALELPTQPLQPSTQSNPSEAGCVPNNPPQTGRVVEILDGNTVRVLIEKLVYVVRYTGVAAPENKTYADTAKAENSKLVYGKEVTLVVDVSDKDPRGRLLRYVMQGNTFINLKMIEQGLGSALNVPPDSACASAFEQAEKAASAAMLGIWLPTATPGTP